MWFMNSRIDSRTMLKSGGCSTLNQFYHQQLPRTLVVSSSSTSAISANDSQVLWNLLSIHSRLPLQGSDTQIGSKRYQCRHREKEGNGSLLQRYSNTGIPFHSSTVCILVVKYAALSHSGVLSADICQFRDPICHWLVVSCWACFSQPRMKNHVITGRGQSQFTKKLLKAFSDNVDLTRVASVRFELLSGTSLTTYSQSGHATVIVDLGTGWSRTN